MFISKALPLFQLKKIQIIVKQISESEFDCMWNSTYKEVVFDSTLVERLTVGPLELKFSFFQKSESRNVFIQGFCWEISIKCYKDITWKIWKISCDSKWITIDFSGPRSLHFGAMDTLSLWFFVIRGCHRHCRMFRSIHALRPLDACPLLVVAIKSDLISRQDQMCPKGAKPPLPPLLPLKPLLQTKQWCNMFSLTWMLVHASDRRSIVVGSTWDELYEFFIYFGH